MSQDSVVCYGIFLPTQLV